MRMQRNFVAVLLLALVGCASPPQQPTRLITPFNYAEHDRYLSPTNATLRGVAALQLPGGGAATCAGSQVLVVPATTFFREMMEVVKRGQQPHVANEIDPVYRSIIKVGGCDAQGRFVVTMLAPGAWIVATEVVTTGANGRQAVPLMREVSVVSGENPPLALNDADRVR
jgi:hypothetical protein